VTLIGLLFPDAEAAVVRYLRPLLVSHTAEVHVRVPTTRPSKFVTVRRAGGTADKVFDRPLIDVFAWAPTDEEAKDLAQLVRALLGQMRGSPGSGVRSVADYAGLSPAPDPSAQARWTFSVQLTTRGVPT
jgi:hypothetical protein